MLLIKNQTTGELSKGFDQLDHELLLQREGHGNWSEVIDLLLAEPVTGIQEYSYKLVTGLALWGLEEFEKGRGKGSSGREMLSGWNL